MNLYRVYEEDYSSGIYDGDVSVKYYISKELANKDYDDRRENGKAPIIAKISIEDRVANEENDNDKE